MVRLWNKRYIYRLLVVSKEENFDLLAKRCSSKHLHKSNPIRTFDLHTRLMDFYRILSCMLVGRK